MRLPMIDRTRERKGGLKLDPQKITTLKTQGYRRGVHEADLKGADRGRGRTRNLVMKEAKVLQFQEVRTDALHISPEPHPLKLAMIFQSWGDF